MIRRRRSASADDLLDRFFGLRHADFARQQFGEERVAEGGEGAALAPISNDGVL